MTDPYVCHINGVPFTINENPVMLASIYHTYMDPMGMGYPNIFQWCFSFLDDFDGNLTSQGFVLSAISGNIPRGIPMNWYIINMITSNIVQYGTIIDILWTLLSWSGIKPARSINNNVGKTMPWKPLVIGDTMISLHYKLLVYQLTKWYPCIIVLHTNHQGPSTWWEYMWIS